MAMQLYKVTMNEYIKSLPFESGAETFKLLPQHHLDDILLRTEE
jgi:hypothetical protein